MMDVENNGTPMAVEDDSVKDNVTSENITEVVASEPATDSNGRSKRVRKTKVRLEEEDAYLNDALGLNKKKRPRKESNDVGQFQNANANASLKRYKPKKVDENKRMSANAIAIKELEKLSDRSLRKHLPVLRYFLTPKVIERLETVEEIIAQEVDKATDNTQLAGMTISETVGNIDNQISADNKDHTDTMVTDESDKVDMQSPVDEHTPPLMMNKAHQEVQQVTVPDMVATSETADNENGINHHANDTADLDVTTDVNGTSELVTDVVVKQPTSLTNVKMRPYQIDGLQWLVEHYQRGINCILADGKTKLSSPYLKLMQYFPSLILCIYNICTCVVLCSPNDSEMGLGKTLQTISYFAYLKDHKLSRAGPHLVVVPLSVLFNWVAEMKKFCPTLRILRLHTNNSNESARLRDVINAADSYDVLITTYEMIKGSMEVTMRRILWTSMVLDGV